VAPGRGISFALALAAGVLEYRLLSGGGLMGIVPRKEILRMGKAMREALKLANEELEGMVGILEPLERLLGKEEPTLAQKKRFLARRTAFETRLLLEGIARLGIETQRIGRLDEEFVELVKTEVAPAPLITGDDLVAAGMTPGPAFRKILEGVYDAQLEGRVGTKEEALRMAREWM